MLIGKMVNLKNKVEENHRELLLNSFLVLMSIMLVVAGAEAYLRVGMGISTGDHPKNNICIEGDEKQTAALGEGAEFHPEYGWTHRPNRTRVQKKTIYDDWDTLSINSNGFRDGYNTGNKSVVVLGDSFTRGALAGDNETYPHLLDRWNQNISFHNYGISGYGTAQELLVYQDIGSSIDHDLVILGYVSNDPRNNMGITPTGDPIPSTPVFTIEDGELIQSRQPQAKITDPKTNGTSALNGKPILRKMDDTLSEYSALHNYLAPTLQGILVRFGVIDTKYSENYEPKIDQRIRLTRKLVDGLSSEAEKNDAKLVIVPIPPREIARQNGETSRLVGNKTYWKRQKQMLDLVANKRSNTEVLSIQPEITDRINNGNKQYGIRNGHFNEQGYKTMAELIQKRQFDQQISYEKLEKSYGRNSKNCPV